MSGELKKAASYPLADEILSVAESRCKTAGKRLTPARREAYLAIRAQEKPVSAYDLIAVLEKIKGKKIAPLTVYRHLDFLTCVGLVHRLESTHSYVACDDPGHTHESHYLLCSACGDANEVESPALENLLDEIAGTHGFQTQNAIVEIKGVCGKCAVEEGE